MQQFAQRIVQYTTSFVRRVSQSNICGVYQLLAVSSTSSTRGTTSSYQQQEQQCVTAAISKKKTTSMFIAFAIVYDTTNIMDGDTLHNYAGPSAVI